MNDPNIARDLRAARPLEALETDVLAGFVPARAGRRDVLDLQLIGA
ncbi:hypothetical protein [Spirillospora sp. CA-128828]